MNRRNFIISAIAAPAIVRAEILMPVTKIWTPSSFVYIVIDQRRKRRVLTSADAVAFGGLVDHFAGEIDKMMRDHLAGSWKP